MASTVEAVIAIPAVQRAAGLRIAQLDERVLGAPLDPFLMCDCFWMAQPFFPPHPHAGMSAVTYMLPESDGGFVNRDSRGDRSLILPGAIHWTEAARGVMHEEVPITPGTICQGLQIFVNLPASTKLAEPRIYHLESGDVPLLKFAGGQVRILAGALGNATSPVQPRTTCALLDVTLDPETSIALPLPAGWRAFGILTKGLLSGFGAAGLAAVRFADGADELVMSTDGDAARVVIFAGQPLNEPVAFGGPFVMNTAEQLKDAARRYAEGDMGRLTASF